MTEAFAILKFTQQKQYPFIKFLSREAMKIKWKMCCCFFIVGCEKSAGGLFFELA